MKLVGIISTLIIAFIIPFYMLQEPEQQEKLLDEYYSDAVISATDIYAENCVICHGASGEGIGDSPSLNSDAVRIMLEKDLEKVISRGRNNTLMAAWAYEEGGIFSNAQISDLVTFLQYANWEFVEFQVAEMGLLPPQIIELEVTEDMLATIALLPDSETLGEGLIIYGENCAACHNGNGSGTVIAPAIDSQELRDRPYDDLIELVNNGVGGTIMASWENILDPAQIDAVIGLIYRWPEIIQAGIEFPEVEFTNQPATPEMIEAGNRLFHIACKACHGESAYGSPMAPALNNQIFLSETPDVAIYQIIAGGVSETLMPAWGARLTNEDLLSLVAYLRSLEATAPSILPAILD